MTGRGKLIIKLLNDRIFYLLLYILGASTGRSVFVPLGYPEARMGIVRDEMNAAAAIGFVGSISRFTIGLGGEITPSMQFVSLILRRLVAVGEKMLDSAWSSSYA
jgi:hypothetical protein